LLSWAYLILLISLPTLNIVWAGIDLDSDSLSSVPDTSADNYYHTIQVFSGAVALYLRLDALRLDLPKPLRVATEKTSDTFVLLVGLGLERTAWRGKEKSASEEKREDEAEKHKQKIDGFEDAIKKVNIRIELTRLKDMAQRYIE
jgi:hypothetical protein